MSNVTDEQLKAFIERVETVNEKIGDLSSDRADIFAEAKGKGYDTKIMKDIIRYRKMNPDARQYWEEVFETYKLALGHG